MWTVFPENLSANALLHTLRGLFPWRLSLLLVTITTSQLSHDFCAIAHSQQAILSDPLGNKPLLI